MFSACSLYGALSSSRSANAPHDRVCGEWNRVIGWVAGMFVSLWVAPIVPNRFHFVHPVHKQPEYCMRSGQGSWRSACPSTRSDKCAYAGSMPWQHLRISRFGGPEVLEMVEEPAIPQPGAGEVRIKVLAAGTGFTDTMIRRGRYPDFKGPLPFTPGYDIVGVVEKSGPGVVAPLDDEMVADLCVVGGY